MCLALELVISSSRHKIFSFFKPKRYISLVQIKKARERQLILRYFQKNTHGSEEKREEESFRLRRQNISLMRLNIVSVFSLILRVIYVFKAIKFRRGPIFLKLSSQNFANFYFSRRSIEYKQ